MINKFIKICIILLFVSTASAAVYYIATNPEARLFFSLDHPEVNPMQHLFYHDGFTTNSLNLGLINSDEILVMDVEHKNEGDEDHYGRIYILIECDEGISLASHTHLGDIIYDGIADFDQITYKHPGQTIIECNNMSHIEVLSDTMIKILPMEEETKFSAGYSRWSLLTLSFNPMAYGNYTLTINTEEV